LVNEDLSLRLNSGFNRASSIELTGLGAGQAIDWTYNYYQARMKYKDLFVQGFVNMSDAGDTYLLTSGRLIVDKSRLWVAQLQHRYSPSERVNLTYGLDAIYTRPNTEATINGRHEDDDSIDELGAYLQSDMKLNDQFKLIAAARVDDNNRLKDMVFSPRAALVYQPKPGQNFRATYNRAYSTPDNNNLFLDILQKPDVFGIGASFSGVLGYEPNIDLRVQGVPETGFTWRMTDAGPSFRSPFAPLAGLTSSDYIAFNDPAFTNVMWTVGRGAVLAAVPAGLQTAVASVTPPVVTGVNNTLMTLDPDIGTFVPSTVDDIADIERLEPTITQTFELGYKGNVGNRFSFSVDAYRTNKDNFIGPLTVETPNIFMDPATLAAYLGPEFAANYAAADPATQAALDNLDANGNGPVDELTAMFVGGAAGIPFGTASPEQAYVPDAVMVTYRNFGDVSFYGADFAFACHLHRNWDLGGVYSYVSKNFFEKNEDQVHDINLNAPRHKVGLSLRWAHPEHGLNAQTRFRWVDEFDMDSPFFGSTVESYYLFDLNVGVKLFEATNLSLTIQNVLDEKHIEFVGGPELGRLAIARVTQTF
ncbi:MAG: TonB-dependent receptor, partial [candidate division Zixibacteria bacterium]|nr:TonB-dependent receptor [candidate division Zixibacteria bacterium]